MSIVESNTVYTIGIPVCQLSPTTLSLSDKLSVIPQCGFLLNQAIYIPSNYVHLIFLHLSSQSQIIPATSPPMCASIFQLHSSRDNSCACKPRQVVWPWAEEVWSVGEILLGTHPLEVALPRHSRHTDKLKYQRLSSFHMGLSQSSFYTPSRAIGNIPWVCARAVNLM